MKALLVLLVTLTGCAVGMTPEQLKAMEGMNMSTCVKSPGWNGSPLEVHVVSFGGKSTGTAGGGGEAACGNSTAKFNNEGRYAAPQSGAVIPPGMTIGPGATPGTFTLQPK